MKGSDCVGVIKKHLERSPCRVFGLDIETGKQRKFKDHPAAGLSPQLSFIRLIQIYDYNSRRCYVFDVKRLKKVAVEVLKGFIRKKSFCAHYAIFESKHLQTFGASPINLACSQIAAQFIYHGENSIYDKEDDTEWKYRKKGGFSLENLCGRYFGVRVAKGYQKSDWGKRVLSKGQVRYAALDAVLTRELFGELVPRLEDYKVSDAYERYCGMIPVIAWMENVGIFLDKEKHTALIDSWKVKATKLKNKADRYFSGVNMRSPKQLDAWVKERYSNKPDLLRAWPKSKKSKLYSFDKEELSKLPKLKPITSLLAYRKYATLLSTFGDRLQEKICPSTGRLHGSFVLGETRTGRLSSREPNLQNMPARDKAFRSIFTAPKGRVLVIADFSQIEIRVGAELSRDPVMLEAFRKGIDLHRKIVSIIARKSIEEVTDEERQLGKAVNFGLMYGMGGKRLCEYAKASYGVIMTHEEGNRAWAAYHLTYRRYSQWCAKQRAMCTKLGYARTPLGRMRKLNEKELFTTAINTPIQGGAAEVNFCSLVRLRKVLKGMDAHAICTVHDENIIECDEAIAEDVAKKLEDSMVQGMLDIFPKASTQGLARAKLVTDWSQAK